MSTCRQKGERGMQASVVGVNFSQSKKQGKKSAPLPPRRSRSPRRRPRKGPSSFRSCTSGTFWFRDKCLSASYSKRANCGARAGCSVEQKESWLTSSSTWATTWAPVSTRVMVMYRPQFAPLLYRALSMAITLDESRWTCREFVSSRTAKTGRQKQKLAIPHAPFGRAKTC